MNSDDVVELIAEKEKSTTELSSILNRNFYDTLDLLERLESEGKIERINVGKFTFWKKKL